MKLTTTQKQFLDKIIRDTEATIKGIENQIKLYQCLEVRTRKDGSKFTNFRENFGIKGVPTRGVICFDKKEMFVKVDYVPAEDCSDKKEHIKVWITSIPEQFARMAGIDPIDSTFLSFTPEKTPLSPEDFLREIQTTGIKEVQERLKAARNDLKLAKSEQFAEDLVAIGKAVSNFRKKYGKDYDQNPCLYHWTHAVVEYPNLVDIMQ